MNQPAQRKLPLNAETIAQKPKNRLPSVNALGMTTTTCRIVGRRQPRPGVGSAPFGHHRDPDPRGVARRAPAPRVPAGRKRSTREPKRIMPIRSPWCTAVADAVVGDDPPGDEPRDLPDEHLALRRRRARPTTARSSRLAFSAAGVAELAGVVVPVRDRAVGRIPVHVAVEHVHEDRDRAARARRRTPARRPR